MGDKNFELGPGDLLFGNERIRVDAGELTMTTEEECDDTAFPLKLSPSEFMGTINDIYAKGLLLGMIEQIRARALYIRASIESNNWRKMHGYPMRRRLR